MQRLGVRKLLWCLGFLFFASTAAICEDDEGPPPLNCYELSVEACAENKDACAVSQSTRYNDSSACWGTSEALGCVPKEADCDQALSYSVDADGACWRHSNGCALKASGHTTRGGDPEDVCGLDPRANTPCTPGQ